MPALLGFAFNRQKALKHGGVDYAIQLLCSMYFRKYPYFGHTLHCTVSFVTLQHSVLSYINKTVK